MNSLDMGLAMDLAMHSTIIAALVLGTIIALAICDPRE